MEVIEKFAAYIIFIAFIAGALIYLGVTALIDYRRKKIVDRALIDYRRKKGGVA